MAQDSGSSAGVGMIVGALLVLVAIIAALIFFGGGGALLGGGGPAKVDVNVAAPGPAAP